MDRKELKKLVPHGYGKLIAEKAGVTPKYVSQFLNEKNDSTKIEIAVLEVIAELKGKRKQLLKQIIN
jgi:transcriptional regulator with XRE-family HTH domain